ncbi:hypothetical protein [Flavisericum labens]|uniref:hypothetical protein n=1 Tax=Flavisericum labens TaxID=3377112 RepID=UPI00387B101A
MGNTSQNHNINLANLVLKLFLLVPHYPRIIKHIKKAKAINSNSNESIGTIIGSNAFKNRNVVALKYEDQVIPILNSMQ